MFGRRSHPRLGVVPPAHGRLRVLRDVVVRRLSQSEVVAVSREHVAEGEMLRLDVDRAGASHSLEVEALESRPLIIDGAVRHQIRLRVRDRSSL